METNEQAALDAAREIADHSSYIVDNDEEEVCFYCWRYIYEQHKDTCPWLRLRRALGMEE